MTLPEKSKIVRKAVLLLMFSGFMAFGYGQAKEKQAAVLRSSHELKMNILNAMAFKAIDLNYEYVLNENSSFGLGIFFKMAKAEVQKAGWFSFEVENNRSYSLTPHYRRYFSQGNCNGFFIEGFGMLNSGETVDVSYENDEPQDVGSETISNEIREKDSYTHFALGISLGGKFIKTNGFSMEIYSGLGIGLLGGNSEVVTRGGLSLGYRF